MQTASSDLSNDSLYNMPYCYSVLVRSCTIYHVQLYCTGSCFNWLGLHAATLTWRPLHLGVSETAHAEEPAEKPTAPGRGSRSMLYGHDHQHRRCCDEYPLALPARPRIRL